MLDAPPLAGADIAVEQLSQRFGDASVLRNVDLAVAPGEVLALLGPSGCGKTSLLRLLAGLAAPTAGLIRLGGTVMACAATRRFTPPETRGVGMVFQDYALWPHMSVADNVGFPLRMRRVPRAQAADRVAEALALVGLAAQADRNPGTLSGGQQQRVALARAVVANPSVVLFDEPLSNLDRDLRETLAVEIAALLRRLGLTAVYVTHDHAEAFAIADRVAVLLDGTVAQVAEPEELVGNPASAAVAAFLKLGLVAEGAATGGCIYLTDGPTLAPPAGLAGSDGAGDLYAPRAALSLVAPEDGTVPATVLRCQFRGEGYHAHVSLSSSVQIDLPAAARVADGAQLGLAIDWRAARWFPRPSSRTP